MGFTFTLYLGIGIYLIGLISILVPIRQTGSDHAMLLK
jgi:hypothetical protein